MSERDTLILLAIYVAPSVAAIVLSAFTRSKLSRVLLLSTGTLSLLILAAIVAAEADCQREITTFYGCRRMHPSLGRFIGLLQVLYVLGYLTLGPILLVIAAFAEWQVRRRS